MVSAHGPVSLAHALACTHGVMGKIVCARTESATKGGKSENACIKRNSKDTGIAKKIKKSPGLL